MYQALYRKYRATNFDELVGQKVVVRTLKNEIINDHLSHAYLFTGPRGTGKTSVAKLLAKSINCDNNIKGESCNNCINCTQINRNTHVDIVEIDAASNNGVDEIREIKSKIGLVPSLGKYKVYIIDEVHMLTIGAFNALLKTLEEPPAHVIFILATTDPHKIPVTILSRCQRFDFKKIDNNSIIERLNKISIMENVNIEHSAIVEIARLSDGGMRDALSIFDQAISYKVNNIVVDDIYMINGTFSMNDIFEIITNIINNNLTRNLSLIDKYNDMGKDMVKLVEELIYYLRNILIFQATNNYLELNTETEEKYKNISQEIKTKKIIDIISELNNNLYEMKKNQNPKLILELTLIKMTESFSKNDLNEPENKKNNNEINIINTSEIKTESVEESSTNLHTEPVIENDLLNKIKEVRINNCLAGFNKKEHIANINKLSVVTDYVNDINDGKYVAYILDAELKASGNNYLIYVCPSNNHTTIFNLNLDKIEKTLRKIINAEYKIISVSSNDWENIKKEFNSKTKKYEYIIDNYKSTEIVKNSFIKKKKENNDIEKLFIDIVEYEEK